MSSETDQKDKKWAEWNQGDGEPEAGKDESDPETKKQNKKGKAASNTDKDKKETTKKTDDKKNKANSSKKKGKGNKSQEPVKKETTAEEIVPSPPVEEKETTRSSRKRTDLLMSKCALSAFLNLSADTLKCALPDNSNVDKKKGELTDLNERMFLALLMADATGYFDKKYARPEHIAAMTCAEFYHELIPDKLHYSPSKDDLCKYLTLALRRSELVSSSRDDEKFAKFVHKLPSTRQEEPSEADLMTLSEIFWVISVVCKETDAIEQLTNDRKRALVLLGITLSKQGNATRHFLSSRSAGIKDELKVDNVPLSPDYVYSLWDCYLEQVSEPIMKIFAGSELENTAPPEEDLTKALQSMTLNQTATWSKFFERLRHECSQSPTLKKVIVQAEGGNMTVAIKFREAYQAYEDFDWNAVFKEFPAEQNYLWADLEDLAADPYCSFGKPESKTAHSRYVHLGYLALSLLEKVGGNTTLSGYKGLAKFEHLLVKRFMIDRWVSVYATDVYSYGPMYGNQYYDGYGYDYDEYSYYGDEYSYDDNQTQYYNKESTNRGDKLKSGFESGSRQSDAANLNSYEGGYTNSPYSDAMFDNVVGDGAYEQQTCNQYPVSRDDYYRGLHDGMAMARTSGGGYRGRGGTKPRGKRPG